MLWYGIMIGWPKTLDAKKYTSLRFNGELEQKYERRVKIKCFHFNVKPAFTEVFKKQTPGVHPLLYV